MPDWEADGGVEGGGGYGSSGAGGSARSADDFDWGTVALSLLHSKLFPSIGRSVTSET